MNSNTETNKKGFSIKSLLVNAKIRIKLMSTVILICLFALVSMSIATFLALNGLADYAKQVNKTLINNAFEGASESMLDQARNFLHAIATEHSQRCNNTLNELKEGVMLLSQATRDLFANPQYYPLSRPIASPNDDTEGTAVNTYILTDGVSMSPQIEHEIGLLSHLSLLAPSILSNRNISEVYVALESGLLYFYSSRKFDDITYDPRLRPWYKKALENPGEVIFTDVYEDRFGKGDVLTAAKAIFSSSGDFIGVAAIDIEISNLQDRILSTSILETGYMIIVDNNDRQYIVHPDMNTEGFEKFVPELGDGQLSGYDEGLEKMLDNREGFIEGEKDGEEIFMIVAQIPAANWSIGVIVYKDSLLAEIETLTERMDMFAIEAEQNMLGTISLTNKVFVVIFILVAIMVAISAMRFSYIITKPIQRLAAEVMSIGEGDFGRRISVDSLDEIGHLAEAYNRMMDNMSSYAEKIVDLDRQKAKLEITASTDALTGILNRGRFIELSKNIIERNSRNDKNKKMFIILFDLDHFKQVNDTYGHDAGDIVLQSVANNVKSNIASDDIFARYGGEEFIIFIESISVQDVLKLAERIRRSVFKMVVQFKGITIPVSASFGVAHIINKDFEAAISNADEALYKAKSTGRNRVVLYNKD